jgi:type I restriction enzyme, S subunit
MKAGWQTKNLADLCVIRPPKSEARERVRADALVSFAPMEDLGIDRKFLNATQVKPLASVAGSYTYFADGDVLLAKITPCFENGKLGIATGLKNRIGFGSSEFIVFRPGTNLDKEYLYYYLSRPEFRIEGAALMGGAVGQQRVPKEFIESYPIPFPSLPEQKRIVGILDEAFDGIATAKANAETNLQNARALFESYLQSVFTQARQTPAVPIASVAEVFDGPHATPKTVEAGPLFLGISALQDGTVNLGETRHVTPDDFRKWTRRVRPRPNDVVFSYETRIGQAAIIPEGLECCLGRRMGLVRLNRKRVDPRFFVYQYISPPFREFLNSKTVRGATVDRISVREFPSFPIALPQLAEQERIANQLDAYRGETQRLESLYEQKLVALDTLKKSLLHQAFSGQL